LKETVSRELEVMFSKETQPIWFRITKWMLYAGMAYLLRGKRWFWVWVLGIPILGLGMHLFYRWKTHGWTESWGGYEPDEEILIWSGEIEI
jgi:hypothetical protein